jgi:periplasmic protein TonB
MRDIEFPRPTSTMFMDHRTIRVTLGALVVAAASAAFAGDDIKVVARIEPAFPHEALAAGADSGKVRARVTIDGSGEVKRVEIVEANPRRLFDRSVTRALAQWRFNSGADGRSYEIDLDFKR